MARKMAAWHPKHGPITKIMLPDGVKGVTASLALELWYDFHEVGCHLGNVGQRGFLLHADRGSRFNADRQFLAKFRIDCGC